MTITITSEHINIGIIIVLIGIQIYQQRAIKALKKECDDIWSQIGTIVASISNQIVSLQKDIDRKENKK